jgi:hypothetical protein
MKLKHWQGYGSVEVKKVSKTTFNNNWGEKKTKLVLSVKGNHECGLVRDDIYDVKRWLFDRFEKNFSGEYYDIDMSIKDDYVDGVEVATYTFIY